MYMTTSSSSMSISPLVLPSPNYTFPCTKGTGPPTTRPCLERTTTQDDLQHARHEEHYLSSSSALNRPCLERRPAQVKLQSIHTHMPPSSRASGQELPVIEKLKGKLRYNIQSRNREPEDYFSLGRRRTKIKSTLSSPPVSVGDEYRGRSEIRTRPRSCRSQTPMRVGKTGRAKYVEISSHIRGTLPSFQLSPLKENLDMGLGSSIDPSNDVWKPLTYPPAISVKSLSYDLSSPDSDERPQSPTIITCHKPVKSPSILSSSPPPPQLHCSPSPPFVHTDHVQRHVLPLTPNSVLVKDKRPVVEVLRDVLTHSKSNPPPSISLSPFPSPSFNRQRPNRHYQRYHELRIRKPCNTSSMIGVNKLMTEEQQRRGNNVLEDGPLIAVVSPPPRMRTHIRSCDQVEVGTNDFTKCRAAQYVSAMCTGYN